MKSHKAAFDAGEVECLVILIVIILGAEVFIPVTGHILLEESNEVFEEFETVLSQFIAKLATGDDDTPIGVVAYAFAVLPKADIDIQTSLVNTDADAICIPHNTARISVTISRLSELFSRRYSVSWARARERATDLSIAYFS